MGGRTTLLLIENIHKEITVIISVEMVIWPRAKKAVKLSHNTKYAHTQSYNVTKYIFYSKIPKRQNHLANQAK